jgi:hypothetical protein
LYRHFNSLLSNALVKSFEATIVSNVYELKFEDLAVNVALGNIEVYNVTLVPREKPLHHYPYINSSFQLKTKEIILKNVDIFTLLRSNTLFTEKILITQPDIDLSLNGNKHIFIPFKDSTNIQEQGAVHKKKPIDSFTLNEFQLADASFHVKNTVKQREFKMSGFNISLFNLMIEQKPGKDQVSFHKVELSLGEFKGDLRKEALQHIGFKNFTLGVDSLLLQISIDTVMYRFQDFKTGLKDLDLRSSDGLLNATLKSFQLSYQDKSIQLDEASFKPHMSAATKKKKLPYQHQMETSGSVGSIHLQHVNFDSLIYYQALFIEEITIDKPSLTLFKDNTKPVDQHHFPDYPGQQIRAIPIPVRIRQVKATNIHLKYTERKRDSTDASIFLHRGSVLVQNITNTSKNQSLIVTSNAYLLNKVPFYATLDFSYSKPQFTFKTTLGKFNMPDLNPIIEGYAPAKILTGTADEIDFFGTVYPTYSSGTMKFLYHDLKVDLELQNQARWKSSVLAFAANSMVHSNNPASDQVPPRIVAFHADRDMHKSFVNLLIKSSMSGVKETMLMSKENRKKYHQAKHDFKKANKKK